MKKKFFLFASMALMLCGANAQSKLSTATRMLLSQQNASGTSTLRKAPSQKIVQRVLTTIRLEKGATVTDEQLAALDIQVERRCGILIFANVPVSKLTELAEIEGVSSVDTGMKRKPKNDKAREASSVDLVHNMNVVNSMAEVPGQYRGKGVLVAIIDNDIDLEHLAFKDADGKCRIKYAEEYVMIPTEDEEAYTVKHLKFEEDEIDQAILYLKDFPLKGTGHGTHVAGVAAGSTAILPDDDSAKNYYGMAPESDLLVYDITDNDSQILNSLADAFERADRMQRPLVVNMSLGWNDARLDGTDEFNENLEALVENYDMTGKIICVCASNEGSDPITVQMECNQPIENDTWTFQHALGCVPVDEDSAYELEDGKFVYEEASVFSFYASDNREFAVQYVIMDPMGNEIYAHSPLLVSTECMDGNTYEDSGLTNSFDLYEFKVTTEATCSSADRTYLTSLVEFTATVPFRVQVTIGTRSEGMQIDGAMNGGEFDANACTTPVNSWGSINQMLCNDVFIGVGAYNSRLAFEALNYPNFSEEGEIGDISVFSSYCHPHYGSMNPLCAAPGMFLLSAMHQDADLTQMLWGDVTFVDDEIYLWAYEAGTSMSSPAATGIVALWLQANPNLTREDVIEILANTCDYDEYCEASPLRFGYGKINAKRGMDYILDHTVGLTSVGNNADCQASKYIDANGRIMISKGERNYDVMGVESK